MTIALRYAARSDVGLLRDGNEDSLYAGPRLLAIADGMGGQAAGEVASSTVIGMLAHLDEDAPGSDLLAVLGGATTAANEQLRDMVRSNGSLEGMGTTLTAMLVDRGRVGLVHVGDSRGYLLRDGELSQITHDHSLVQRLVDEGRLTAEEAAHHPQRSLILRALDGRDDVDLDLSVRELRVGDRYLLCTDGLTDVVTEPTIREALAGEKDPKGAVDRLVDLALRGGGPDNITCIVADVVEDAGSNEVVIAGAAAAGDLSGEPSPDTPAGRAALAARAHDAEAGALQRGRTATAVDQTALRQPSARSVDSADSADFTTTRRPSKRRLRIVTAVGAALFVVAAAVLGTWLYVRSQYYVGAKDAKVAILRGVSGSFLGIPLHSVHASTGIGVDQLPQYERGQVEQGINAASLPDAQRIVARLRAEEQCSTPLSPGNVPQPGAVGSASAGPTPGTTTPTPSTAPTPSAAASARSSTGATPCPAASP